MLRAGVVVDADAAELRPSRLSKTSSGSASLCRHVGGAQVGTYWAQIEVIVRDNKAFPLVGRRFVMVGLTGLESANRLGWTTIRGE